MWKIDISKIGTTRFGKKIRSGIPKPKTLIIIISVVVLFIFFRWFSSTNRTAGMFYSVFMSALPISA